MNKAIAICVTVIIVSAVAPAGAALYNVVDDQAIHGSPGQLNLLQTTGLVQYYSDTNHRIYSLSFTLTNNSATTTYTDVKLVDPFEWLIMSGLTPNNQACGWVDAQYQWINPEYNGNDGLSDGLYVKTYNGLDDPPESGMLMSNTNIPLTSPLGPSSYETASVLATDKVPSWSVAASLAPGQSVSFKVYLDIERRGTAPNRGGKTFRHVCCGDPRAWLAGAAGHGRIDRAGIHLASPPKMRFVCNLIIHKPCRAVTAGLFSCAGSRKTRPGQNTRGLDPC